MKFVIFELVRCHPQNIFDNEMGSWACSKCNCFPLVDVFPIMLWTHLQHRLYCKFLKKCIKLELKITQLATTWILSQ